LASVRLLIKSGVDLNARGDQHNCSPLAWAAHGARYSGGSAEAENNYISIVRELIDAGATVISGTEDYDHAQFSETIESIQEILKEHGWSGE
jgi:N-acetyl-anhydromuramyl-L-alanine amidase AmpD